MEFASFGMRKKEPRTGGSAAEALNFGDSSGGEAGRLRVWIKMSGVEEGGGEPSSGIPPTKKAPPVIHRSGPSWPINDCVLIDVHRQLTGRIYSRPSGKSKGVGKIFYRPRRGVAAGTT